jgi:signal transduction histidine kinase
LPSTNNQSSGSEKTEVLYGSEKTAQAIARFLSSSQISINICADSTWPFLATKVEAFSKGISDVKTRNVNLRFITEITIDNIEYCKELMQISELRHLDGIKGNFATSEKEYASWATMQEANLLQQILYSNVKAINEQQQYVFETLWNRAKPAEQKVREIEGNIDLGSTELIHNTKKILDLFLSMIQSAKAEILLMLPTTNAFLREERIGAIKLLDVLATEHDVNVRIITPTNDVIEKILRATESGAMIKREKIKNKKKKGLQVQRSNIQFKETSMTTVTILVVDKKESLAIEKTDDSKENFMEAIGLSTYSNSGPTVMSYVSMFEILWRQVSLYEELSEANEQLQIHDKMQREFINVASHEMKTPTQAILGTSGLLQHYPDKRDELIEIIGRNAKRLQTLISNILDVTRIESQTLILNKELINMHDLISSVTEDYKVRKQNVNIKFISDAYSNLGPVFVEADKDRIIQVLSNLLDNAIKFTNQGEISINLFARIDDKKAEHTGRVIVVSVTDTGSGINSEIFNRLFTKFTTRSYQGTGLGLFICKSIIEAHGGRIWAQNNNMNQENGGATIMFSLPAAIETVMQE